MATEQKIAQEKKTITSLTTRTKQHKYLSAGLATLLLRRDRAADDVLAHVVLLRQVEHLADLRRTLRTEPVREVLVRHTVQLALPLLHNRHVQHRDVLRNDAPAHRLALALTVLAVRVETPRRTVQQQAHTVVHKHALLHSEALLVTPASDAEDVPLELVTKGRRINFLRDALVEEDVAAWGNCS